MNEKVNRRKQNMMQVKKEERNKKILHHCSWLSFLMAALLLMLFGSEKVETSPYVYIVAGFVVVAILLRLGILLPERRNHQRKIGKL